MKVHHGTAVARDGAGLLILVLALVHNLSCLSSSIRLLAYIVLHIYQYY